MTSCPCRPDPVTAPAPANATCDAAASARRRRQIWEVRSRGDGIPLSLRPGPTKKEGVRGSSPRSRSLSRVRLPSTRKGRARPKRLTRTLTEQGGGGTEGQKDGGEGKQGEGRDGKGAKRQGGRGRWELRLTTCPVLLYAGCN
jgi:hypothetical protein